MSRFVAALAFVLALLLPGLASAAPVLVSGRVTDNAGTAVTDTTLEFLGDATATTDATGSYAVSIEEGVYDIVVTPPPESIFLPQTIFGRSLLQDTTLNVVLVSAATVSYDLTLQDRGGLPLENLHVCLAPVGGGSASCGQTGVDGRVSLAAKAGDYRLNIDAMDDLALAEVPRFYSLSSVPFSLVEDLTEVRTIPVAVVTGVVTDDAANPVAGAQVSANTWNAVPAGWEWGHADDWTTSQADGSYTLFMMEGDGQIRVSPPQGSGLATLRQNTYFTDGQILDLALPAPVEYALTLEDRGGLSLPGLNVCVASVSGGSSACGQTDADGLVVLTAAAGEYQLHIDAMDELLLAEVPRFFSLSSTPFTLAAGGLTETRQIPVAVVTGVVTDALENPVAGAQVSANTWNAMSDGWEWGHADDWTTTQADGSYTIFILEGDGQIRVSPPQGSGLASLSQNTAFFDGQIVDIALPVPVDYTLTLEDRGALPLAGLDACLQLTTGGSWACGQTDASGTVTLTVTAGDYRLHLDAMDELALAEVPRFFSLSSDPFTLPPGGLSETRQIPVTVISGTVVDADGGPVADASVSANVWNAMPSGWEWGHADDWITSDANGEFTLYVFDGDGQIRLSPGVASGFAPFTITKSFAGDESLAVLLQFLRDAVAATVSAGGSVGTDDGELDGATASDPIETTVTSPVAGTVTIEEAPITEAPPTGYTFLTQQVNISAPPSTAIDPIRLVFQFDASRVPEGLTEADIEIFRNGVLVSSCTGVPGQADPDPCVTARTTLGDGDIEIVVLTSAASAWNIGVREQADDDPDEDGVPADEDNCPDDPNPAQVDQDQDGVGNACDPDLDGDGVDDVIDNCPDLDNPQQQDLDGDGIGDACDDDADEDGTRDDQDNCLGQPNPDQADSDGDGQGDACDGDDDDDGVPDGEDVCPLVYDPAQLDADGDGHGDACDGDDDGDDVADDLDACGGTPGDAVVSPAGCSGHQLVDLLCGVPADHDRHGHYVSCVADAADAAADQGLIAPSEKGKIVSAAAKRK